MEKYDKINSFSDGSAYVCLNGKWGYVNKAGEEIVPCQYDYIEILGTYPCHNLLWVKLEDKIGIVDQTTGKEIVPCKYDFIDNLSGEGSGKYRERINIEEPIKVSIGGKFGYVRPVFERSEKGEITVVAHSDQDEIIIPKYENASRFADNLAAVQLDGKWGLIDKQENMIIPLIHDENSIQEACKQYKHVYQYLRCISEGSNMDEDEYECIRCKHTKIEQYWHWSQD